MINITFPDGNVRQYAEGTTALDVAKSISEGLARVVLSASVNGEVRDLTRPITSDASIKYLLNRFGSLSLFYRYTYRNSDIPAFSYDKDQVGINVTAQF